MDQTNMSDDMRYVELYASLFAETYCEGCKKGVLTVFFGIALGAAAGFWSSRALEYIVHKKRCSKNESK